MSSNTRRRGSPATATSASRGVPKPSRRLSLRITHQQHTKLETLADRESNTVTAVVRRLLARAINSELQLEVAPSPAPRP
jgi:FixJ family two-component response regulator